MLFARKKLTHVEQRAQLLRFIETCRMQALVADRRALVSDEILKITQLLAEQKPAT